MKAPSLSAQNLAALQALANDPSLDAETRKRVEAILDTTSRSLLDDIEKQVQTFERAAKQKALSAMEAEAAQKAAQRQCSHIKFNPVTESKESFLSGQHMQGGRLVLFCQNTACQKVFSSPPLPELGWDPIPPHLMPKGHIGGVIDLGASVNNTRRLLELEQELNSLKGSSSKEDAATVKETSNGSRKSK